jgi:hypothetical protein
MDEDEYAAWAEMNRRITGRSDLATRPCADCTLGYASEMRAVGRCNGTPAGVEEEPDMEQPEPVDVRMHRRVPVALTPPPCASCAHEPVCALRRSVEGIAEIPVVAPPVPDGLTITLVAAVECSHFLRDRSKPAPARARGATDAARSWNGGPIERQKREVSEETRAKMRAAAIARGKAAAQE